MPRRLPHTRATTTLSLAAACVVALGCGGGEPKTGIEPKPGSKGDDRAATVRLGFPAFATKNTTRVGGADEIADAAGVALAVFPSQGAGDPPEAVALADRGNWQAGIAAAALAAPPLHAPLLLTDGDQVPDATSEALGALRPRGGARTRDAEVLRLAGAPSPEGYRADPIAGRSPSVLAAAIDRYRAGLVGRRSARVLIVSQDAPAYSMPAAGWAAKSGDAVLYTRTTSVPLATRKALKRHGRPAVYVLGPKKIISESVLVSLRRLARSVRRVSGEDPVRNAVAFARYFDGRFGWNVNDPGHGLVIASTGRPADAGAAASLSASGKYGPLLLNDEPGRLAGPLEEFLLDIKPGYRDDPSRAVYNHAWLIGDVTVIDVAVQAEIDELAELAKVRPGPPPGL